MRKRAKNKIETKVQVYTDPTEMKVGVRRLTRRGWRVVSQSGNFNLWNPFGRDTVTVVFEKREEESPNAVDSHASTVASTTPTRACPNCGRQMNREASVCPHCHVESAPWIRHAGFSWAKSQTTDRWQWLDETAKLWRWYPEGTPSNPSATTDQTPSRALDPAVISPPGTDSPIAIERQDVSAELERLADLHARGVLTDEEFQQAKQRVLRG